MQVSTNTMYNNKYSANQITSLLSELAQKQWCAISVVFARNGFVVVSPVLNSIVCS